MESRNNMAIYDQWSHMTTFEILEVVLTAPREGIQIEWPLYEESLEK